MYNCLYIKNYVKKLSTNVYVIHPVRWLFEQSYKGACGGRGR